MHGLGRGRRRLLIATIGLVIAACSRGEIYVRDAAPSPEPPPWLAEGWTGSVAALGDDLVSVGDSTGDASPQLRHPDGTWEHLPRLPARGQFGIVLPLGDTVLVAGRACGGDCESGPFRMFRLSGDRTRWITLDAPRVTVGSETEVVPYPGPSRHAVVFIDGEYVVVDRDGEVHHIEGPPEPPDEGNGQFLCAATDAIVAVPHHYVGGIQLTLEGAVQLLRLDDLDTGWQSGGQVPAGVLTNYNGSMCGPDSVTVFGGPTQTTYTVSSGAWSSGPANFQELTGTDQVPWSWDRAIAWSPDHTTAFLVVGTEHRVIRRVGDGLWQDTGRTAWSLTSTASAVLAYDPAVGPDFVEIWHTT